MANAAWYSSAPAPPAQQGVSLGTREGLKAKRCVPSAFGSCCSTRWNGGGGGWSGGQDVSLGKERQQWLFRCVGIGDYQSHVNETAYLGVDNGGWPESPRKSVAMGRLLWSLSLREVGRLVEALPRGFSDRLVGREAELRKGAIVPACSERPVSAEWAPSFIASLRDPRHQQ